MRFTVIPCIRWTTRRCLTQLRDLPELSRMHRERPFQGGRTSPTTVRFWVAGGGHRPHRLQPHWGAQRLQSTHRRRAVSRIGPRQYVARRKNRSADWEPPEPEGRRLSLLRRRRPTDPGTQRLLVTPTARPRKPLTLLGFRQRAGDCASSRRTYSAEDMQRVGAVNIVADHADLETEAVQMAREISAKSPTAQRMLKFAFNLTDDGLMGQQVFAGEATRLAYMTDEAVEGRDSFLEKRDPDWSPYPYYD